MYLCRSNVGSSRFPAGRGHPAFLECGDVRLGATGEPNLLELNWLIDLQEALSLIFKLRLFAGLTLALHRSAELKADLAYNPETGQVDR